jgi:hypothetical protein
LHLKLVLRCCNLKLQRHVDQAGVGLVLHGSHVPTTALQLTSQRLASLNTMYLQQCHACKAPPSTAVGDLDTNLQQQQQQPQQQLQLSSPLNQPPACEIACRCQAAVVSVLQQLEGGLPALRFLTIAYLQQPELLAAVLDACPTGLRHLKLVDRPQAQHKARPQDYCAALTPEGDLQQRCNVLQKLPGQAVTSVSVPQLPTHLHLTSQTKWCSNAEFCKA